MIDICLGSVAGRLNTYLQGIFSVSGDMVVLAPLTDSTGVPAAVTRNRIAMFLLNVAPDHMPRKRAVADSSEIRLAPVHLDVYFMLAAAHEPDLYAEGLKQISAAMMFFQANPLLTPQNMTALPAQISQLSIELADLNIEDLGQLWGSLGGRHLPSVTYKMRSVVIDAQALTRIDPRITSRQIRARPAEVL